MDRELDIAIEKNDYKEAKRLIREGAYINLILENALKNKNYKKIKTVMKMDINVSNLLKVALERKDYEGIERLIKLGVDPHTRLMPSQATLLHLTVFKHDLKAMELLSKLNVDFNSVDEDGETSLHWLFSLQRITLPPNDLFSILCFFIENNIDVSIKEEYGLTALDYAINYYAHYYEHGIDSDTKESLDKIFTTLILALLLKHPTQLKFGQIQAYKSLSTIWRETKQLITQLKKEKIEGSCLSYYDLAIEKPDILAIWLSISQFSKILNDIQNKYPLFYISIKNKVPQIEKALKERSSLLNELKNSILSGKNDINKNLNSDCIDKIISFLSNSDLRNNKNAFTFTQADSKKMTFFDSSAVENAGPSHLPEAENQNKSPSFGQGYP